MATKYFEVSAKSGSGIEDLFKTAGEILLEKIAAGTDAKGSIVLLFVDFMKTDIITKYRKRKMEGEGLYQVY